jgi:hypothetical protein
MSARQRRFHTFQNYRALTSAIAVGAGPEEPIEFAYLRVAALFTLYPDWALHLYNSPAPNLVHVEAAFEFFTGRQEIRESARSRGVSALPGFTMVASDMAYPFRDGMIEWTEDEDDDDDTPAPTGVLLPTPHQNQAQPARRVPAWAVHLLANVRNDTYEYLRHPVSDPLTDPREARRRAILPYLVRSSWSFDTSAETAALYLHHKRTRSEFRALGEEGVNSANMREELARRFQLHTIARTGTLYDLRASKTAVGRDAWWHTFCRHMRALPAPTVAAAVRSSLAEMLMNEALGRADAARPEDRHALHAPPAPTAERVARFDALVTTALPFIDVAALCRSALDTADAVFFSNYAAQMMVLLSNSHMKDFTTWAKIEVAQASAARRLIAAAQDAENRIRSRAAIVEAYNAERAARAALVAARQVHAAARADVDARPDDFEVHEALAHAEVTVESAAAEVERTTAALRAVSAAFHVAVLRRSDIPVSDDYYALHETPAEPPTVEYKPQQIKGKSGVSSPAAAAAPAASPSGEPSARRRKNSSSSSSSSKGSTPKRAAILRAPDLPTPPAISSAFFPLPAGENLSPASQTAAAIAGSAVATAAAVKEDTEKEDAAESLFELLGAGSPLVMESTTTGLPITQRDVDHMLGTVAATAERPTLSPPQPEMRLPDDFDLGGGGGGGDAAPAALPTPAEQFTFSGAGPVVAAPPLAKKSMFGENLEDMELRDDSPPPPPRPDPMVVEQAAPPAPAPAPDFAPLPPAPLILSSSRDIRRTSLNLSSSGGSATAPPSAGGSPLLGGVHVPPPFFDGYSAVTAMLAALDRYTDRQWRNEPPPALAAKKK